MKYKTAIITDIGKIRKNNEDNFLLCKKKIGRNEILLAAVADGMGGLKHGEMASRCIVKNLDYWWQETIETMQKEPELSRINDMISFVIENSHIEIRREINRLHTTMGTTLSLLFLWKNEYVAKQIGDSRIYLLDKGEAYQITVDQTWCQEEVDAGRMTKEEMKTNGKRHILSNALGAEEDFYIKTITGTVRHKQRLLLCSDGYYSYLDKKELQRGLLSKNLQNVLEKSRKRIRKGEAEDNLTAILIEA